MRNSKIQVDIGPNIKDVLLNMVWKISECNPDEDYYNRIYSKIYSIIVESIKIGINKGGE